MQEVVVASWLDDSAAARCAAAACWYVATGAGGREAAPVRMHEGVTLGCLGMDTYAFAAGALALQTAMR